MHTISGFALLVGATMIGAPLTSALRTTRSPNAPDASARFVNNTPEVATLRGNGEALFVNVPAGQVTAYTTVSDSVMTFRLELPQRPGEAVSVRQVIEPGARYTLTARIDMEGRPTLTLVRDEQRISEAQSQW